MSRLDPQWLLIFVGSLVFGGLLTWFAPSEAAGQLGLVLIGSALGVAGTGDRTALRPPG